jgi:hypothetical protein
MAEQWTYVLGDPRSRIRDINSYCRLQCIPLPLLINMPPIATIIIRNCNADIAQRTMIVVLPLYSAHNKTIEQIHTYVCQRSLAYRIPYYIECHGKYIECYGKCYRYQYSVHFNDAHIMETAL